MKQFWKNSWKNRMLIAMSLPAVILVFLFSYVPIFGLVLSFKKFDFKLGIAGSPWCGFDNFRYLFLSGKTFYRITRNTVGYYILFTITGTIGNIAIAIGINEFVCKRLGKTFQSIMIVPTFISYMAVNYTVYALLKTDGGLINQLLQAMGLKPVRWYFEKNAWPVILLIVKTWKGIGYGSVLYLSVLAGIDQEMYEAAALDGAGTWKKTWYITLPMLIPMAVILMLLGVGSIMHSDTGLFYQVTRNTGALYETTQVIDSYVLNAITSSTDYGVTAATTFYQSAVGCILMLIVNQIVRKISPDNALF